MINKINKIFFYRLIAILFVGIFVAVIFGLHASISAPKLAVPYLSWRILPQDVDALAKRDLLILDMETQVNSREYIKQIRSKNPDIILLAYISSQEVRNDASGGASQLRRQLAAGIQPEWYLQRSNGSQISFWGGTTMLNPTDVCPAINGKRWNDYLTQFVADNILSTGLWDGVFYDNTWGDLTWFTGKDVDLNRDNIADSDIDTHWRHGMAELLQNTFQLTGRKYFVVGNAYTKEYANDWNGFFLESFQIRKWTDAMYALREQSRGSIQPRILIINSNSNNTGNQTNYRDMRFGLVNTLLVDGYYSYDYGDQDHSQLWWYDEYNVDLGNPIGAAYSQNNKAQFSEDIWRRDFTNGIAVVNPTDQPVTVDLGSEYEKIIGQQDKAVNNGAISDRVQLGAHDGIIMRKSLQSSSALMSAVFGNGNFARFFDVNGNRARNGFFASVDGLLGGARIYSGDLDSVPGTEKVVVTGPQIEIFNDQGDRWFQDFPFGVSYKGNISFAVGVTSTVDNTASIILSGSSLGKAILYNYYGSTVRDDFYPFGKKYKGGICAAIGDVDGGGGEIMFSPGGGRVAQVLVYSGDLNKIKSKFYPFGSGFYGSVKIASGNVLGGLNAEIVALAKVSGKLQIRIFDARGKILKKFNIPTSITGGELNVSVVDVNSDGLGEIVVEG